MTHRPNFLCLNNGPITDMLHSPECANLPISNLTSKSWFRLKCCVGGNRAIIRELDEMHYFGAEKQLGFIWPLFYCFFLAKAPEISEKHFSTVQLQSTGGGSLRPSS